MKVTNLWDEELVEASNLTIPANEEVTMLTSEELVNTDNDSFKLTLTYSELQPSSGTYYIGCVTEFEDENGDWRLLPGFQFNPIRNANQAMVRIIILQPDLDTINAGTDDSVFPLKREIARISRAQGLLPESTFRVRVILLDTDPEGANAFVSIKVSAEVEQYDV